MLLSDRFLGFFMVPTQGSWNYNFMGMYLLLQLTQNRSSEIQSTHYMLSGDKAIFLLSG